MYTWLCEKLIYDIRGKRLAYYENLFGHKRKTERLSFVKYPTVYFLQMIYGRAYAE